jgi:sortase A
MPLIYDSSWPKISRTIKIKKIAKLLGRGLVIFSFVGLLLTYFPIMALETQQFFRKWQSEFRPQSGFGVLLTQALPTPTPTPTPEPLPPKERRFQLIIPKIGADACVLANIDPSNPKEYGQALQKCVAHVKGSGLPGQKTTSNWTTYLFAHSTNAPYNIARYNAIFYFLKDLEVGDKITIWFWGQEFTYFVFEKKILSAQDTTYFQPQTEEEQLILQTCYPPGTTLKQLVIIAKPIN